MTATIVSSGQTGSGTTLFAGDQLIVLPGGSAAGVVNSGGTVISGGVAILSGGALTLASSAVTSGTVVTSGGRELVLTSGVAAGTAVSMGGQEDVYFGGYSSAAAIASGGQQNIRSGGVAIGASASAGGAIAVSAGGTASAATVGGTLTVTGSGALAVSAIATSGAVVFVQSGGTARGLSAAAGTTVVVQAGGVLQSGSVAGTTLVSAGGVLSGVSMGGRVTVLSGGVLVSGGGGTVDIQSGGVASGIGVGPGGFVTVFNGGVVSGLKIQSTSRYGAGQATVSAGGVAIGTIADAPLIVDGGTTIGTNANSYGLGINALEVVKSGGRTSGTIGYQTVSSGGTAIGTLATNQGVLAGGVASGTVIRGGTQTITSGGAAFGTSLGYSGYPGTGYFGADSVQTVSSGGLAVGTVISLGGIQAITPGGVTSGATLLPGGIIRLLGTPYIPGGHADYDAATHTLSVVETGFAAAIPLSGDYTGEFFHLSDNNAGGTDLTVDGTPCYCHGTAILTDRGEIPVERLSIGDRIVTASGHARPIAWLGRRAYAGRFAARNPDIMPVLIRAGALGGGLPRRDLRVSPLHAMAIDGVLVPAAALVDGFGILQPSRADRVDYVHIELASHDILVAEGAPSESFIDDDSRAMFHNAAEYRMLYPDAPERSPATACPASSMGSSSPKSAGALPACPAPPDVPVPQGRLDEAGPTRIAGWALDGEGPATLRILDNGALLATITADEPRADLLAAGIGDGRHGFAFVPPFPLSPAIIHVIHVQHDAGGQDLANSPLLIEPPEDACTGRLDTATRLRVTGWALDEADPDGAASIVVTADNVPVAEAVANAYRADLAVAGIGRGWHAFDVALPTPLPLAQRHVVHVRRQRDGAPLPGSPIVIEPAAAFDTPLEQAVVLAVASLATVEDQARALDFLAAQAHQIRRQRAEADGRHAERQHARQARRQLGPAASAPDLPRRALVIDDRVPVAGRDAGSQALLSHIRALQRLGYEVSLAASEEMDAPIPAALPGVAQCGAPFYDSVETVLRRQADCFDVVYLHRIGSASRYMALARGQMPRARILYSVADLHHVRLERQAAIEERPELLALSRRTRLEECTAAWSADAVITHSLDEQALLQAAVPTAQVHLVGWDVPRRTPARPFKQRRGVGFVGHYAHAPNVDAAEFLVEAVMPLVWQADPDIPCLLVGAGMTDRVRALAGPRVAAAGAVPDLGPALFDQMRLTVAPLRYGAGVKGKVMDSLAAGVPCAMTPIAAEGLPPGPDLAAMVAPETAGLAAGLAALILRLHGNQRANRAAVKAGHAILDRGFTEARVDAALLAAIEGRRQPG